MLYESDYQGTSLEELDGLYEIDESVDDGLADFDVTDNVRCKMAYEDEVPEDVRNEIRTLISEYGNKDRVRKRKSVPDDGELIDPDWQ